jgi:hypothetical protein
MVAWSKQNSRPQNSSIQGVFFTTLHIQGEPEKSSPKQQQNIVLLNLSPNRFITNRNLRLTHIRLFWSETWIIHGYPDYSPSEKIDSSCYYHNEITFWSIFFWITLYNQNCISNELSSLHRGVLGNLRNRCVMICICIAVVSRVLSCNETKHLSKLCVSVNQKTYLNMNFWKYFFNSSNASRIMPLIEDNTHFIEFEMTRI